MTKDTIEVGSFGVNCTILTIESKAWVIDPGSEGDRIAEILKKKQLPLAGILLTHAHFDHICGVSTLQARCGNAPVYIGENDRVIIEHPFNQYPPEYPISEVPLTLHTISEGSTIEGLPDVTIIDTPGHTPGGVCYLFRNEKLLFSGDTLFASSIGRTDLPGGDMATLMNSLKKLKALEDDITVIPGHGMFTTIGRERDANPFLQ